MLHFSIIFTTSSNVEKYFIICAICIILFSCLYYCNKKSQIFMSVAVQNERQPRNSATIRPEFLFSPATKPSLRTSSALDSPVSDITVGVFSPFFTLPSKLLPSNPFGVMKYQYYPVLNDSNISEGIIIIIIIIITFHSLLLLLY